MLEKYVKQNAQYFWSSVGDVINLKHLDTLDNLIQHVNTTLSRMQDKLVKIKDEAVKCKFTHNTVEQSVAYEQPKKFKCQLHISPKLL